MLSITNTYGGYTAEASEDEDGFVTLLVYNENNKLIDSRVFLRVFMENEKDVCEVLNSMRKTGLPVSQLARCFNALLQPRHAIHTSHNGRGVSDTPRFTISVTIAR